MQKVKAHKSLGIVDKINDYKILIKFRLNIMVVFSAILSYLILAGGSVNWIGVLALFVGGMLVAGAANALNQVLEKDYDRLMERTKNRPLAADRMSVSEAVMAAGFMSVLGITILGLFNPLTAFLGMLSLLLYAFVYTPLKRFSTVAVIIGAIPGAMPVLIGGAAVEGYLSTMALILFAIQFFWQLPHFWAIGWLGHEDYTKAGYKMIGEKSPRIGLQAVFAVIPLIALSILPMFFIEIRSGAIFLGVIIGLVYGAFAWNFYMNSDRNSALRLMFSSFFYLPIILFTYYIGVVI